MMFFSGWYQLGYLDTWIIEHQIVKTNLLHPPPIFLPQVFNHPELIRFQSPLLELREGIQMTGVAMVNLRKQPGLQVSV